jgi:hypothetical protein
MRIAEQLNYTVPCASMLWGQFQFSDDVYVVQFHKCWQDFSTRSSIIFFNKKLRLDASSITTGDRNFAVCLHIAKPGLHTAKDLPCVAHDNQASAKGLFAVGFSSGTRQSLCRVQNSTLGKKKRADGGWRLHGLCRVSRLLTHGKERTFAVCQRPKHTAKSHPLPCAMVIAHGKCLF